MTDPEAMQPTDSSGSSDEPSSPDDAPVVLPIVDFIDLHAFSPKDIRDVVLSYLDAVREIGLREVRLIHGKGIGAQRQQIRSLLSSLPFVERFDDAPADRGHWGATLVWLAPPEADAPAAPLETREGA